MNAVWLFPGQGAQSVGMGLSMIDTFPRVSRRMAQGSEALGLDLHSLLESGPPRALARTDVAQVAIFCLGAATSELLRERGFEAGLLAGHSLGLFTAVVASGAVGFEDGLALVTARGAAMHASNQSVDGGMLVVHGSDEQALSACLRAAGDGCRIANRNAPGQFVVAGSRSALRALQSGLRANDIPHQWLDVAGPYHTPLMQAAAIAFEAALDACPMHDPDIPLLANSDAAVMSTREQITRELRRHMLTAVDWSASMGVVARRSPALLVEVGPGRVLKGLALRNAPRLRCVTTATPAEFDATCRALWEVRCES